MKKAVFVTGAASGTGYAIARRFAREGWAVFVGSRSSGQAQAAARALAEEWGVFARGYGYRADALDERQLQAMLDDIRAEGFLLDTLVLNAANLGIGQVSMDVDINDFMAVYQMNVGFNFLLARNAARQMREKGGGAIVFIGSNSATRVTRDRCAYCSSKNAIIAMSRSLAVDWGRYGIRSNCVLPGMIKTRRWENNVNGARYSLPNRTPLGDIAEFEDVANAAWYLGSEQSRNTTGTELVVDGGMLAQLVPDLGEQRNGNGEVCI